MASDQPVITASTGLGGYAGSIVDLLLACQEQPDPPAKLVAVTSSNPAKHPERLAAMQAKGVKLVSTYEELLADKSIQAVWLPLPIDLHRPYTEQALAAGKAVMCEKPWPGAWTTPTP
jgi:predicted dehydrogenase